MTADGDRLLRRTFVRRVEWQATCASTNDLALDRAAQDDGPWPLLIWAGEQTAGRGRGANRWWSAPGALTFSLVLEPGDALPPRRWPLASLTAGLSVCDALRGITGDERFGLKWPNDVYCERKKVCGILIESPARRGDRLVFGVGINVNNAFRDAPADVRERATSLADATGREFALVDVLERVLNELAANLARLAAAPETLHPRWEPRCILTGRTVTLEAGAKRVTGACCGLGPDGELLVATDAGIERFYAGVVAQIAW